MIDKKLLAILCCPVTHKSLAPARKDLLKSVNQAIAARRLTNRDGAIVENTLREALVTEDGKTMYPIADGIPVLLEGESVPLDQLEAH